MCAAEAILKHAASAIMMVQPPSSRRSRRKSDAEQFVHRAFSSRNIIPMAALVSVALCLPVLLVSNINLQSNVRQMKSSLNGLSDLGSSSVSYGGSLASSIKASAAARVNSFGSASTISSRNLKDFDIELDGPDVPMARYKPTQPEYPEPLAPYTLTNVLTTTNYFHETFGILVYDPPSDSFIAHYPTNMRWISGCHKLIMSMKTVANSLRIMFPSRFTSNSDEFAIAIGAADYPGIKYNECIRGEREDCFPSNPIIEEDGTEVLNEEAPSPVLQFGSSFRNQIMPTMLGMPMPQKNQLSCFHTWATQHQVCQYYLPRSKANPDGLVFPETIGVKSMDELIPQVVWRGTDFSYLHKMVPNLRTPNFEMDIASQIDLSGRIDKKMAGTQAMRQIYDELIPRWKGVVLTAEAEREVDSVNNAIQNRQKRMNRKATISILQNKKRATAPANQRERREAQLWHKKGMSSIVPWVNIKLASAMYMGQKTQTSEIEYYQQFEEFGVPAIGEGMSLEEMGRYKYHIDLGGGGGTTWSGTLEKLGLPGLLFHHMTPTKDYLHDKMEPWVHYVPIKSDLSDLKAKFDWAESHPKMAQQISDNATQLARTFGTPEGMEKLFKEFFEWPMSRVVESYQSLPSRGSDAASWRDEMGRIMGDGLRPIMACSGYHLNDCEKLVDDINFTRSNARKAKEEGR